MDILFLQRKSRVKKTKTKKSDDFFYVSFSLVRSLAFFFSFFLNLVSLQKVEKKQSHHHPSVDLQHLAGDVSGRRVQGQELDHAGDLLGLAVPPDRDRREDALLRRFDFLNFF